MQCPEHQGLMQCHQHHNKLLKWRKWSFATVHYQSTDNSKMSYQSGKRRQSGVIFDFAIITFMKDCYVKDWFLMNFVSFLLASLNSVHSFVMFPTSFFRVAFLVTSLWHSSSKSWQLFWYLFYFSTSMHLASKESVSAMLNAVEQWCPVCGSE